MSFWKRIFGGGGGSREPEGPKTTAEVEHNGFVIRAQPYRAQNGQYQTAGIVTKGEGEALREHRFVRADSFPSIDDATEFALRKGRQIVDEQGEKVFR